MREVYGQSKCALTAPEFDECFGFWLGDTEPHFALWSNRKMKMDTFEAFGGAIAFAAGASLADKAHLLFTFFDFDRDGVLSTDELTMLIASCVRGMCRLSRVPLLLDAAFVLEVEAVTRRAFDAMDERRANGLDATRAQFVQWACTETEIVSFCETFASSTNIFAAIERVNATTGTALGAFDAALPANARAAVVSRDAGIELLRARLAPISNDELNEIVDATGAFALARPAFRAIVHAAAAFDAIDTRRARVVALSDAAALLWLTHGAEPSAVLVRQQCRALDEAALGQIGRVAFVRAMGAAAPGGTHAFAADMERRFDLETAALVAAAAAAAALAALGNEGHASAGSAPTSPTAAAPASSPKSLPPPPASPSPLPASGGEPLPPPTDSAAALAAALLASTLAQCSTPVSDECRTSLDTMAREAAVGIIALAHAHSEAAATAALAAASAAASAAAGSVNGSPAPSPKASPKAGASAGAGAGAGAAAALPAAPVQRVTWELLRSQIGALQQKQWELLSWLESQPVAAAATAELDPPAVEASSATDAIAATSPSAPTPTPTALDLSAFESMLSSSIDLNMTGRRLDAAERAALTTAAAQRIMRELGADAGDLANSRVPVAEVANKRAVIVAVERELLADIRRRLDERS